MCVVCLRVDMVGVASSVSYRSVPFCGVMWCSRCVCLVCFIACVDLTGVLLLW